MLYLIGVSLCGGVLLLRRNIIYIRLDIVNKEEYETSDDYREIKILFPRDSEDLERDFEYLGLDYRYLEIQDSHIKECEIIYKNDPAFASDLSDELNLLIDRASSSGYTTPFNDMKVLHELINNINNIIIYFLCKVNNIKKLVAI